MDKERRTVVYLYRSPYGPISIRPDLSIPNSWFITHEVREVASNGETLALTRPLQTAWWTPEQAANAVREQRTGWPLWDSLPPVVFPGCLDDWEQIEVGHPE